MHPINLVTSCFSASSWKKVDLESVRERETRGLSLELIPLLVDSNISYSLSRFGLMCFAPYGRKTPNCCLQGV